MGNQIKSGLHKAVARSLRFRTVKLVRKCRRQFFKNEHRMAPALTILILAFNLGVYQNCAPANFSSVDNSSVVHPAGNPDPNPTSTTTTVTSTTTSIPAPPSTLPPPPPSNIQVVIPDANIDFGQVLLNTTSPTQSITIMNQTPDDTVVINLITAGASQFFSIDQTSCSAGIAPNMSCTISFRFTPTNLNPQDAIVQVTATKKSDSTKSASKQFHLLGQGFSDLAFDISSASLDFGSVVMNTSSSPQSITVTNRTPSSAVSISISQTNGAVFTATNNCANVAYNSTCTIQFVFNPKDPSSQASQVTLTASKASDANAPAVSKTVSLTGQGLTDLNISMPALVDFGKVRLNSTQSKSITITNLTPSSSVSIAAQMLGSDFVLDSNSPCLKQAVATNASCLLNFSYAPSVTTLKTNSVNLTFTKIADSAQSLTKPLSVTGSGFIIPPSTLDQLFLVGWYARKESVKVSYANRTADNTKCPAPLMPSTDLNQNGGQQREFCFEPSGAHGLQLSSTTAALDASGNTMKNYILQNSVFQSVPTLDQLFSSPADHTSDNATLQEALFYYALGYLNIPHAQAVDSQFDVKFVVHYVDDGLALIVNNRFAGYWNNVETWGTRYVKDTVLNIEYYDYPGKDFPISLITGKDNSQTINPSPWGTSPGLGLNNTFSSSPLIEGANTVMTLWLDDSASQRNIVGAKLQYKAANTGGVYQDLQVFLPNVIQGYAYDSITGNALSGISVKAVDASTNSVIKTGTTDSKGFYRLEGIPDGNRQVIFTRSGAETASGVVILNHNAASTAILDVSQGL